LLYKKIQIKIFIYIKIDINIITKWLKKKKKKKKINIASFQYIFKKLVIIKAKNNFFFLIYLTGILKSTPVTIFNTPSVFISINFSTSWLTTWITESSSTTFNSTRRTTTFTIINTTPNKKFIYFILLL